MIIIRVIMQCISPALWLTLITSAEEIKLPVPYIGDLMKLRWRQQWERQKNKNNFALASRFLVHFFATPAQLRHEMAKFKWRSLENGNGEAINSSICLNSGGSTLFSSNINSFLFSILATWYNREEVEGCETIFQRCFHGCIAYAMIYNCTENNIIELVRENTTTWICCGSILSLV